MRHLRPILVTTLTAAVLAGAGTVSALSQRRNLDVQWNNIKIVVDGSEVPTDPEPFIVVEKGRTVVPARGLAEALGAKVAWDADTNSVVVYSATYIAETAGPAGRVFAMPARGFSLTTPTGFSQVQPLPPQLLKVLDADRNMQASVASLETGGMSLQEAADFYGEILRGILPGYVIEQQMERRVQDLPALQMTATAPRQGTNLVADLLLINKEKRTWAVLVVYRQQDRPELSPLAAQILNSFRLDP